ncbi:MAG: hypothetical protein ABL921_18955 [Pirellula sp.]
MKESPILFNAPMVRALLDGRKTQTRRVLKHGSSTTQPLRIGPHPYSSGKYLIERWEETERSFTNFGRTDCIKCPFGSVGDTLWVRETWYPCSTFDPTDGIGALYRADPWRNGNEPSVKWKPSIHMPRWASRITLEITSVRVERVNDISEEDAIAEGCVREKVTQAWVDDCEPGSKARELAEILKGGYMTARWVFENLWSSINGKGSWELNPWVWVIEFRRESSNANG